ncbi:MAG TPA: FtsX-like permease family protein [Tepidisphaeraceae bacterium]|nr:FtsX-like permease family protein [Tepidisphaeraceae bacterium]
MYKLHLILKYLRKRRIAWVSLIAVTLCTAMVLIVLSVMGGWLRMFLDTSRALAGDIVIYTPAATGFDHYEEILGDVRNMPQVKAAIPVITTFGMANLDNQFQMAVMVKAYGDLKQVGEVNSFQRSLYRQYQEPMREIENDPTLTAQEKAQREAKIKATPPSFDKPLDADTYRLYLPGKDGFDTSTLPGIIPSTFIYQRDEKGKFERADFIYHSFITLTVGDLTTVGSSTPDISSITYWIVDDCHTGFYPVDNNTVYVPFDKLQQALGMGATSYQEKDADGQVRTHQQLDRCTEIQVALKDGVDLLAAQAAIQNVVHGVVSKYPELGSVLDSDKLRVDTWYERQAEFIGAVVHEKVLLTILFGIISIVAVFLIFCIFYMIVAEKTRDIGIIKSVGASNWGVAQIFLGYGFAIGLLGGGTGLLLAYSVVHNINGLHAWISRHFFTIWDPKTYIFDTIPNTMESSDVIWIVSIAVLSAVLGAVIPAVRAGRMHPVEALRWE